MNLGFNFYKYEIEKTYLKYKKFNPIFARIPAGHVTSAEALQTTSCLPDVAAVFLPQCGEAQARYSERRW
jgi:hypothetical protein